MEIQCTFEDITSDIDKEIYFVCGIKDQKILENQEIKFIGKHEVGRSKYDVASIYFHNCEITKVPQGLTKIFPNLKIMDIRISNLKKLTRIDLVEYKNLKEFRCYLNQIEFLPGDLFEDFKNLEYISFYGNHLRTIEPNILDGLTKLKFVDFRENLNYNKWFSIVPQLKGNSSLEELKHDLRDKFFSLNSQIAKDYCLKLQHKIQHLRESKEKLVDKNHKLKFKLEAEKSEKSIQAQNFRNQIEVLTLQLQTGLHVDLISFIESGESFKDLKIKINDREFHVHKLILAGRSPTLAELLRNNPGAENIELVGISVEIFEKILKFIYTDELPRMDDEYLRLFSAAGRLQIEELKNFAAEKAIEQINSTNVIEVFILSNKYGHDGLRKNAYEELRKKYPKIEFKDEWMDQSRRIVEIIKAFEDKELAEKKFEEALNLNYF